MNSVHQTYYPSKILFFGEYTVTLGSDAIAIPFDKFAGSWKFGENITKEVFLDLVFYLKNINWSEYNAVFLENRIIEDLNNGLYFDSNIKTGYGAGSSGALCAALFDRYFTTTDESIHHLNMLLAKIESYFHGISSGIDPLVSYLNKAVKTTSKRFEVYDKSILRMKDYSFYLLDSNISRSTKKFVKIFKEKIVSTKYINEVLNPLISYNNSIVSEFTKGNENTVFELFNKISKLQFQGFESMIIPELIPVWKDILPREDISIKLCGAGGGGYYLLMAKKKPDFLKITKDFHIELIK